MSGLANAVQFITRTDVGRQRDHNEDSVFSDGRLSLCVVCDGMGGHAAGEVASDLAIRTFHEELEREADLLKDFIEGRQGASRVSRREITNLLEFAVNRASMRVFAEASKDASKRGMGTTLVALLLAGKVAFIVWVGDSRAYLLRGGALEQVTEDHTVYNELIKRRKMSREAVEKLAPKNAITRAVGVYAHAEPETLIVDVAEGDRFLLCSDGLCGYFDGAEELPELARLLATPDAEEAAQRLIEAANERGGGDNITVALATVGDVTSHDQGTVERLRNQRDVLAGMPLFRPLTEHELRRVLQVTELVDFADGAHIIREGDTGEELFIVLTGEAALLRGDVPITQFGPGDHFGEMALFRPVPRTASVISKGASELMSISRAAFYEILRSEPQLGVKLLWQFNGVLVERLAATTRDLETSREEAAQEATTTEIFLEDLPPPAPSRRRPPGSGPA